MRWLIVQKDNLFRLFRTWSGSYAYGDSWAMNSGITKITPTENGWLISGQSGSEYEVHKDAYGIAGTIGYGILHHLEEGGYTLHQTMPDMNILLDIEQDI